MSTLYLHPDRLLPADESTRAIARRLYQEVEGLPIISPHGHTDPAWFADNEYFHNPTELLIKPDHYVFRLLYSLGVSMAALGLPCKAGEIVEQDPRKIWRLFARHYAAFRGTPTRLWMDYVFSSVFNLTQLLNENSADTYYERINEQLHTEAFRPRALMDRFNIEYLATTESPLDDLRHHRAIRGSDWCGGVITTYRPDPVVDPDYENFVDNVMALGELTGENTSSWAGYLSALRQRRDYFKTFGATATDHGHPSAQTSDLSLDQCRALFAKVLAGNHTTDEAEVFRGQMLTEMAAMSLDDELVMQLHPGSFRNHNPQVFRDYGRDKGADIPIQAEYVKALKPLLDKYGNDPRLSMIVFTLDESVYSRELAPLAGHYPALKLGPPWWFHDSPEGMRRFREQVTETAGFYNTVGFNDDTRAFLSIPARHDVARRMDCHFLARLVAEHRLPEDEARDVVVDLTYNLVKKAYKLK
ncbi:glucuronate isomerase [Gilvimarinus agarilyticus]|uniref:glucuronate isomerase n=1 Tax=Gilvimarinus sp. 2_MG-2023 TaxID=3062666 RepID=UPI001C08AEBB|nr:glucuronate isomerase [Gilvimarinus sp. 2_MG-2023]MBU2885274.1 glucuronate isomerase [Gilvimarinus agarilyticus]MDO6570171.1 glucuronate isomerase [Gilvimarinus sp. 2_MG-2023]